MDNNLLTSEMRGQRTLATVVFTDCVGFSARMSVDEDHTLDLIRRDLKFMKQLCGRYEGRVLKSTGDGLLMCFTSAVKAVECAMEIQRSITERAIDLPPEDALEHRIGIHLADMFITDTDVMGNGVNIAARLQTEADPGGICISQTVFDVIKASLHVDSDYLGPRELKNIREVVPVYRILMSPESQVLNPHSVTIRNLEQSRNVLRVKKLLFYACKNRWESDHNKLNLLSLSDQIQEVMLLAPTPERLRLFLDAAVRTLSKPAEYSLIANILVKELSRLYPVEHNHDDDPTSYDLAAEPQPSPHAVNALYEQLAVELEATGNGSRIKKLAFYVCRRVWETDQNKLDGLRLQDLIAELHQSMPTLERLTIATNSCVQTLSKQAEYALVANALVSKLQRLYIVSDQASVPDSVSEQAPTPASVLIDPSPQAKTVAPLEDAPIAAPPPAIESPLSINPPSADASALYVAIAQNLEPEPNLLRIKKLLFYVCYRQWESDVAKLEGLNLESLIQEVHQLTRTSSQLEAAIEAVVKTLNKQEEYREIAQTIVTSLGRLYPGYQEIEPPPASPTVATPQQEELKAIAVPEEKRSPIKPEPPRSSQDAPLSLFDFRLGIMKYANPLQAKILLFSALYEDFGFTNQDWSDLKQHDLDSLLRRLLGICKTYTDLEACLFTAARRSPEPAQTVQTAEAIIKCLRSFYLYNNAARLPLSPDEPTQLKLDDFEETTLEFASIADEDDYTCQLVPPTAEPTAIMQESLSTDNATDDPLAPTAIAETKTDPEDAATSLRSALD
ncbi:adenylate/guanylate cyclase domain-containing protein [Leptolyngbya sp. FACHB-321]|uniref:adenylate/guanylate cyclase domain-containing protein n=1 Tax=Leptolyngbya sp. FACHB-321 TaxID=2692807 RepID=UPI0016894F82|nr:adenylate/guanylate cyclase domain-containing protein [Leptolyngbya sp. FACHB-321]MBD2038910.1 adenylate/guanylate cyclase domain-containing protein [Leptolyngbya sp. FACHB-321]